MKGTKKLVVLCFILVIAMVVGIVGCGSKDQQSNQPAETQNKDSGETQKKEESTATPESKEPVEITFFWNRANENPGEDNIIIKEIEKKLNVKLKIIAPSNTEYNQKLNITMASGDIPDAICFKNITDMQSYAKQGALLVLDDLLKTKAPNTMKFVPEDVWPFAQVDGKTYAIPTWKITHKYNVYYRQDWMEKLNLDVPKTLDEFYNVMKIFTQNDPDGNGKDDTYGWAGSGIGAFSPFYGAFGVMDGAWYWDESSGQLLPYDIHPGMKEALRFINKMYTEKLVNQDWMAIKGEQSNAYIESGIVGMFYGWWTTGPDREKNLVGVVPDAKIGWTAPPIGPDGKQGNKAAGRIANRLFTISIKAKNPERIMDFYDYFHTPEGMMIGRYGVEGVHWKWKSGQPTPSTVEELNKRLDDLEFLEQYNTDREWIEVMNLYEPQIDIGLFPGWKENYVASQKFTRDIPVIKNDGDGFTCDARIKYGAAVDTLRNETFAKIIIGDLPIDAFDDYVKQWKEEGGDEIIKGMTEKYKMYYGK